MRISSSGFISARIIRGVVCSLLGAAAILSLGACSDMLTYARDAKAQGIQQYDDGKYSDAAGSFANAARQDPTDAETEYWLGLSYEQTRNYHEAINAYKTSLALMPSPGTVKYSATVHDNSFERLARVVALTDTSNTETDLIIKKANDTRSSVDYQLLGRIFRYRLDADTAIQYYRSATTLDPDNFAAAKELGLYLEQLGQNQQAGMVLRDAYRLNQDDKDLNNALLRIGMVPGPQLLAQSQAAHAEKAPPPNNLLPDPLQQSAQPASETLSPTGGNNLPKD